MNTSKYLIISKRHQEKDGYIQYKNFSDEPLVIVVEEKNPFTKQDAFNQFASIVKITDERELNIDHFNIFSGLDIDNINKYWSNTIWIQKKRNVLT